jgi:glucokinase
MFVSIDLGKTSTRVASSKDIKTVLKIEKFPTSQSLEEQKKLIKEAIYKASDGEHVRLLCIGMPGIINRVNRSFYRINTYPELNGLPFQHFLQGMGENVSQITIENDALLAAYGEAVRGSGKEFNIVAYLTLSTGVGGARISFKEIDPSYYFSEPGHQIIVQDGKEDPFCGQKGCLQAYTSGSAFEEIYKVKPDDCKDENIWIDYSKHLSSGLINIISMWAPEVIILGGGLSQKFDFIYPGLVENLGKQKFFPVPEIRKSALGDESGLQGGFAHISKLIEQ